MDLLSTVRKQGTRGGRAEFKWEDVKSSQHRENYLGHSVMAPVGRWQSGRDLNWYAKSAEDRQKTEAEIIAEEKRLIKEQENEMIRQKFGDAAVTSGPPANANLTSLGPRKAYTEDRKDDKHASSEHREHRKHRHHRGRRSRSPSRDRSRERERYRTRLDDTDRHRSSKRERRRDRTRSRSRSPHRRRHNDHASRDHRAGREDGALPRRHKDSRDDKGTFDKYRRERDHDRRRHDRRSQEEEDGRGRRHRDSRRRSRSPD